MIFKSTIKDESPPVHAASSTGQHYYNQAAAAAAAVVKKSQVIHLNDLPLKSTSHVDAQGRPITKQQLIDPFTLVDNLAGISVTSLLPGQSVTRHSHDSMHEFFYILDGQGLVQIDNDDIISNNNNSSSSGNDNAESNNASLSSSSSSSSSTSSSWRSISKGSLVYAAEQEAHAFHVPENASQPLQMIFFGLTTTNHPPVKMNNCMCVYLTTICKTMCL